MSRLLKTMLNYAPHCPKIPSIGQSLKHHWMYQCITEYICVHFVHIVLIILSSHQCKTLLQSIDPSQGVWLTGNLTNHIAESAVLFDKQTRQESTVNYCWWTSTWKFMFILLCNWKRGREDQFTCHLNWGDKAICHDSLKSHKTVFIVWISLKKNDNIWKLRLCFIPKVTCFILSIGTLSVCSFFSNVFFTDNILCGVRVARFVGHTTVTKGGARLCKGSIARYTELYLYDVWSSCICRVSLTYSVMVQSG